MSVTSNDNVGPFYQTYMTKMIPNQVYEHWRVDMSRQETLTTTQEKMGKEVPSFGFGHDLVYLINFD